MRLLVAKGVAIHVISSEYVLQNSQNDRLSETCRFVYKNIAIRTPFRPILQEGTIEVEMQTVGRKFLRGHDRGHGKRENGDRSLEILHKIQAILQKPMLGNGKLATVRQKH